MTKKMGDSEYVYLFFHSGIWRVDLNNSSGEMPPPMEKVVDFTEQGLPIGMGFFVVDSKLYGVGGENLRQHAADECIHPLLYIGPRSLRGLNREVFVFDPSSRTIPFKVDNSIPSIHAGKINVTVANIDGKVYVFSSYPFCFDKKFPSPQFECYDPTTNEWEKLPDPPFYGDDFGSNFRRFDHYVVGHNIYVLHGRYGCIVYDVAKREWVRGRVLFGRDVIRSFPKKIRPDDFVGAGDDGLVITWTRTGLVAHLGANPNKYQILRNLTEKMIPSVVESYFDSTVGLIRPLGEGKYCFVLSINAGRIGEYMRPIHIMIFQVEPLVGTDNGGETFLNAVVLHHHIYDAIFFDKVDCYHPKDVLVMGEHSKKRICMKVVGDIKQHIPGSMKETEPRRLRIDSYSICFLLGILFIPCFILSCIRF